MKTFTLETINEQSIYEAISVIGKSNSATTLIYAEYKDTKNDSIDRVSARVEPSQLIELHKAIGLRVQELRDAGYLPAEVEG